MTGVASNLQREKYGYIYLCPQGPILIVGLSGTTTHVNSHAIWFD